MNDYLLISDFTYIVNTLFVLFSMVLIILMVPGFAMLEAGLVRTKNVATVLTVNTMIYAVASMAFLLIGLIGGVLVVFAVPLFDKIKIDDPVGALSVHLVNGIWGTLAVGIFASDPENGITFMGQLKGVLVVGVFTFVASGLVIYLINLVFKFRASDEEQMKGLDIEECGLEAYPEYQRSI